MRICIKTSLVAVLAGAGWAVCASAAEPDGEKAVAAQVSVVRVAKACFSSAVPVTGVLAARREAVVALQPGDKVVEILAHEGDVVTVDQTLAQISRPSRDPAKPGGETKTETVSVKAPAAGAIIRSTANVGATASPMQPEPLYRIAVDNEMELDALVPSIHVPELSPGQSARVIITNMGERAGKVRLAPSAVDEKTQLGHVRITISRDPQLRFATFAQAVIDARHSCGVSVPRAAVTYQTDGTIVQVVDRDVVQTRSVQIGLRSDTDAEVTNGLVEGDLVLANAGTSLRAGDKVRPVETDRRPDQR